MVNSFAFYSVEELWGIIIREASLTPITTGSNEYAIFGDPSVRLVLKEPAADDELATTHIRSVAKEGVFHESDALNSPYAADFSNGGTVCVVKGINGSILFNIRYDRNVENEMQDNHNLLLSKTAEGKAFALFSRPSSSRSAYAYHAYSGRYVQPISYGTGIYLNSSLTGEYLLVKMPIPKSSDNLTDVYFDFGGTKEKVYECLISNAKFTRCSWRDGSSSYSSTLFRYIYIQVKD